MAKPDLHQSLGKLDQQLRSRRDALLANIVGLQTANSEAFNAALLLYGQARQARSPQAKKVDGFLDRLTAEADTFEALLPLAQGRMGLIKEAKKSKKKDKPVEKKSSRKSTHKEGKTEGKASKKGARSPKIDVGSFARKRDDIEDQIRAATANKPGTLNELIHFLDSNRKNKKFDPNNEDDQRKADAYLRRLAKENRIKLPRGGKGLDLQLSLRLLATVDQVALAGHPAYKLVPEPPKKVR